MSRDDSSTNVHAGTDQREGGLLDDKQIASLAGRYRTVVSIAPLAGIDGGQLPEHGAHVGPVGVGPGFAPPLDVRRLGQIFEQFVRRTYDVVDGRGAVGSVISEHSEQGEGDQLVGQQSSVKVVDLVVAFIHGVGSLMKRAIQAAFGRGVQ